MLQVTFTFCWILLYFFFPEIDITDSSKRNNFIGDFTANTFLPGNTTLEGLILKWN